ncbi:MAG: hypothetical protein JSR67_14385 [Proteobacteria bacterium]|nr:hypothetical protein [Pseudomonadota bacterium]
MYVRAYTHARLMDESEWCVEMAAGSPLPEDLVASRVLDNPEAYRRWTGEHNRLMRAVSAEARIDRQVVQLRTTAMNLVHSKALFEYLQERGLEGHKRQRLFELFFGCRDYRNAVLIAHANYLRSSSSHLCTQHLAAHLMHDGAAAEPLALYAERYADYFRAFCDGELAETDEERTLAAPLDALRPLLKYQLGEARQHILSMPVTPAREWREVEIRRPTGQTQRLRALPVRDSR